MRRLAVLFGLMGVFTGARALATPPAPPKKATAKNVPQNPARAWHSAGGATAPKAANGLPLLVLHSLNTNDRTELAPYTKDGGFSAEDLDRASYVVREPRSGNRHPIEPHLIDLVYRLETHFNSPEIRVVSCYRTPSGKGRSNHGRGRAIDFIVPGATDEEVAKVARDFGFVGVGIYPTSGFIHMDVRDRSYFWVDRSGPGKRNRAKGILSDLAHKSDIAALARGEKPMAPFFIGTTIDSAISNAADATGHEDEDDDEDDSPSP